ncbi:carbohydrate ABC transporter permease [Pseudothermotoga thermarum]|uniref:Binding-protein-dependent transport systems inner membrane component n=1 Tax=Pseudothermotoga thermarum DSM 5069 TaxID=688269 RepID=F7YY70_9THEM|nr:carbohydrate ABC transporter permease [Pseudothermotoga thermarum]AEH50888.1 binding-protein-dependent transport systems inner membrane component [Pseudothermotoga thermarum DSM 5069]
MLSKRKRIVLSTVRAIGLSIFLVCAIFPLLWIVLTSLKESTEVYTFPIRYIPSKISFDAYRYLFSFAKFHIYFKNSLVVSLLSATIATISSLLSGYTLSRFTFKGRRFILIVLFFVQMIPFYVLMIPLFTMFSKLGLTNTVTSLLVIYSGYGAAFGAIMARAFFSAIPKELEEVAWLDGCTKLQALMKVILPVFLPSVGAIFAFCFVNSWNEVFTAVLFIHSEHKMTVPVALYSFVSKAGIQWNVMAAGITIAVIPNIVVFGLARKYIVQGLTQGAIKG